MDWNALSPPVVGFDTETHLVLPGRKVPRMVCLTLAGRGDLPTQLQALEADSPHDAVVASTDGTWSALLGRGPAIELWPVLLRDCRLVAQNAAYDLAVLSEAHRLATGTDQAVGLTFAALEAGRVVCTRIREKLIRNAYGEAKFCLSRRGGASRTLYDLNTLVGRYFGVDLSADKTGSDSWRLRYHELDGVPVATWPTEAARYAVDDALWALEVADAQLGQAGEHIDGQPLVKAGRVVSEARETANDFAFYCLSAWGQRSDPEAVQATVAEWQRLAAQGQRVGEAGGWVRVKGRDKGKPGSVNKGALQGRVVAAYERMGQVAPRTAPSATYPQGQVKYDETTLTDSRDPELVQYATTLQYRNWMSKYADPLTQGVRHPVTPRYDVVQETGRTSCSNPPQQQPPRQGGYRDAWVPRPGWLYAGADYDVVELCALAQVNLWLGHGSAMADALRAGQDLHLVTATGVLQEDGRASPTGDPWSYALALACLQGDHGPDWMRLVGGDDGVRFVSKAANFGFAGGMTGKTFQLYAHGFGIELERERADGLRDTWLGLYPEMHAYFAWCDSHLDYDGHALVKQFVSGRLRGGTKRTAVYNGFFQGLVADGAKYAVYLLVRAGLTGKAPDGVPEAVRDACAAFRGCRPVLFLHDEVISEVPEDRAPEAADAMATIMRWAMARHIPDVPIGADPVLMRRWLKGAKTIRSAQGRLQVWDPAATRGVA